MEVDVSNLTAEQHEKITEVEQWVKKLLVLSGIHIVNFRKDGGPIDAFGLLNVPAKYVGIIDAMHQALVCATINAPLPEFAPPPERSTKKAKRRR